MSAISPHLSKLSLLKKALIKKYPPPARESQVNKLGLGIRVPFNMAMVNVNKTRAIGRNGRKKEYHFPSVAAVAKRLKETARNNAISLPYRDSEMRLLVVWSGMLVLNNGII